METNSRGMNSSVCTISVGESFLDDPVDVRTALHYDEPLASKIVASVNHDL